MNLRPLALAVAVAIASLHVLRVSAGATLVIDEQFQAPQLAIEYPPVRLLRLENGNFLRFFGSNTLTRRLTGAITRYLPDGTLDASFSFSREFYDVTAAAEAPGGKIIISARRYEYYGAEVSEHILRLNPDGSVDPGFNPALVGSGSSETVRKIVVHSDGTLLVAGSFETFAGTPRQHLVRLLPNGVLDETFNAPPMAVGQSVWAAVPLTDGRILFGGTFTSLNGAPAVGVAIVNSDGSVDASFQPRGFRRIGTVRGIVVQSDGKIVLGGPFERTAFPVTRYSLIRLHPDGALDTSFADPVNARGYQVFDLIAQPDGKLIAPYAFRVRRLNVDGAEDQTFAAPYVSSSPLGNQGTIYSVNLAPDGKVLFGGFFDGLQGDRSHFGIAQVNASGQLVALPGLTSRPGFQVFPTSAARLADGRTFATAGGPYYRLDSASYNFLCLRPDGSVDPLTLSSAASGSILARDLRARDLTRLADGAFFVSGLTWGENASFAPAGGKFLSDATEDAIFRYDAQLGSFEAAAAAPDGGVLLSGEDDPQSTAYMNVLSRLRPSGRLDVNFRVDPRISDAQIQRAAVYKVLDKLHVGSRVLAVQPDGRIIFVYFSSDRLWHLVRLHPGGMIDPSFSATTFEAPDAWVSFPQVYDPQTGVTMQPANGVWRASLPVLDGDLMPDGRIIIAGQFTSFGGSAAPGLVRLRPDGTRDSSFQIGAGAQWTQTTATEQFGPKVERVQLQSGGKILIAGTFEAFDGAAAPGIASLNEDGSVDRSFSSPPRRLRHISGVTQLRRQPDGSFLLSGPYAVATETEPRLIRIDSRGGIPVLGSPTIATAVIGREFRYEIMASGQPTSFSAAGLPDGFSFNAATGVISGTASSAQAGVYNVTITAANAEGTSAAQNLLLTVPPLPQLTAAASRKTHGTTTWSISLPLNGARGVECRKPDPHHDLVFTFNNDIISATASVSTGYVSSLLSADGRQLDVRLSGIANAQNVTVTVQAVDSYGQTLSGAPVQIGFLLGDSNGDGTVNSGDAFQARNRSGQELTATTFRSDFNRDGAINSGDAVLVRSSSGTALPPAGP